MELPMMVERGLGQCGWLRYAVVCALITAGGCASLAKRGEIEQQRKQRQEMAVRAFDRKRDATQCAAALSRWASGDREGCLDELSRVLERSPDHRDARFLLAELLLEGGRYEEAVEQCRTLARSVPEDAPVQHLYGLALEAAGQHEEAMRRYQRAIELDSTNEAYRLSAECCAPGGMSERAASPPSGR
jgi:tetratricopeptide (TPR) repeat protein